jgi:hypothetical protein
MVQRSSTSGSAVRISLPAADAASRAAMWSLPNGLRPAPMGWNTQVLVRRADKAATPLSEHPNEPKATPATGVALAPDGIVARKTGGPSDTRTQDLEPAPGSKAETLCPWPRSQLRAFPASAQRQGRVSCHSRVRPTPPEGPACPAGRVAPPALPNGHSAAIRKCCASSSIGGAKTSCEMPENSRIRAMRSAEQSISAAIATTLPMSLGEPR